MVRLVTYVSCSALVTALTVTKYALQYKQFYPTVLGNFALALLLVFGTFLKWAFLNSLRDIEFENMQDRLWVTIMDTLLAMTIFHDEFSYFFFFLFGSLLACKVFHWLASDRVDYIASGTVHGLFTHVRLAALMLTLLAWDVLAFYYCGTKVWKQPPSVFILFAFEYCLLSISMIGMLVKYALNCYDLALEGQWESKGVIILYMDFFVDVVQLFVYITFFISLFRHYGIPLHLVRQIWLTFQSFWKRVTLVLRYIRATSDVDTRFPEATPEQLRDADVCVVCRDGMETGRVLRCGHIMHRRCLLTWLEHSQTCPHCRESVFDDAPTTPRRNHQQAWQAQQAQPVLPHHQEHQPAPVDEQHHVPQPPQMWQPYHHGQPQFQQPTNWNFPPNSPNSPASIESTLERLRCLTDQMSIIQEQLAYMQEQVDQVVQNVQENLEGLSPTRSTTTTTTTTTITSASEGESDEDEVPDDEKEKEQVRKRKVKFDYLLLKERIQKAREILRITPYNLVVWFAADQSVKRVNYESRGIEKPTDVISIPHIPLPKSKEGQDLGEIILGMGYIQKKSEKSGQTIEEELTSILVHGLCHLMGHTHRGDKDFEQMLKQENEVLEELRRSELQHE